MISNSFFKQQNYLQIFLLITVWILGNIWTFQWFIESLTIASPLNIIILATIIIFFLVQLWRNKFFPVNFTSPQLNIYPIFLMIGSEITAILLKWLINIPQLTLLCFILGSYGLIGLFIPPKIWQKNLIIAVITACIIPFSIAFNSGLGFPVRVITARTVAQTLADFHLSAISSHDIIIMENGIAQIDLPCSGMKSLWTGTVFLLGATWLENRQLGLRWLLVAFANIIFLIFANVIRVFTLVIIIEIWQQKEIAQILHIPLGIIGFIIASTLTWILLQKNPRHTETLSVIQKVNSSQKQINLNWLLPVVIILGIIGQFQPFTTSQTDFVSIQLPQEISTETLSLTETEAKFFDNQNTPLVEKLRFTTNNLSGSMLIVGSNTWQAHHPPELCLAGNGLKIDTMRSQLINNRINARWLSLQNGALSATYWFQSSDKTTDDFISRLGDYITHSNKTWVLVSVLFDHPENPNSTEIKDFTNTIYETIQQTLKI